MLVSADGGPVYQVPLTHRGAPPDGADKWLIGTMDHSVLGPRWVYDARGAPVYAADAGVRHGSLNSACPERTDRSDEQRNM